MYILVGLAFLLVFLSKLDFIPLNHYTEGGILSLLGIGLGICLYQIVRATVEVLRIDVNEERNLE